MIVELFNVMLGIFSKYISSKKKIEKTFAQCFYSFKFSPLETTSYRFLFVFLTITSSTKITYVYNLPIWIFLSVIKITGFFFQMNRKQYQNCDSKYVTPSLFSKKVIKLTTLSHTTHWQSVLPWSVRKLLMEIDNGNCQSKQVFLYLIDLKALILY